MPKPRRLLKAHRGRRLVARPRQFAEQRTAPPAQKPDRAPNPLRVPLLVDADVARRRTMPHLAVDAWRKILARRELAAASPQPEDSRQRADRMLDAATSDERPQVHHAPPRAHLGRKRHARKRVHQVDLDEVRGRGRLQHPVVWRFQLANQPRLVQRGLERRSRRPRLDFVNVRYQLRRPRLHGRREVRAHPLPEPPRLPDIEQVAALVAHQVDAGRMRQRRDLLGRHVTLDSPARKSAMMVVEQAIEPRDSHPLRPSREKSRASPPPSARRRGRDAALRSKARNAPRASRAGGA